MLRYMEHTSIDTPEILKDKKIAEALKTPQMESGKKRKMENTASEEFEQMLGGTLEGR